MTMTLSKPHVVKQGLRNIVGSYCVFEGENEGAGWSGSTAAFDKRKQEIRNRKGDTLWGFLYRPHRDHPEISANVMACFMGVEVVDFDGVPVGLSTTRFAEGDYVIVECKGDTSNEVDMGIGPAVGLLEKWIKEHGYREGDEGALVCWHEKMNTPPFRQYVSARIVK